MRKITFLPVSIGGGLLAGLIAKKLFGLIWGRSAIPRCRNAYRVTLARRQGARVARALLIAAGREPGIRCLTPA